MGGYTAIVHEALSLIVRFRYTGLVTNAPRGKAARGICVTDSRYRVSALPIIYYFTHTIMTALLNKKILLSLGIIAFAAALAVGATIAAFSASDDITGNTLATATVSIAAAGVATGGFTVKPVDADDLVPGGVDEDEFQAEITNTSDVPLNLYMYLTSPTGGSCSKTKLAWQSYDVTTATVLFGYATAPTLITEPNFALLSTFDDISEKVLIASSTPPLGKVRVRQKVGLDTSATDDDAGGCVWTETFYGETVL